MPQPEVSDAISSDTGITPPGEESYAPGENDDTEAESIAALLTDIYNRAADTNALGSLDTMGRMVARLGENGYIAVDSGNQVDMTSPETVLEFCRAVDEKESDEIAIIVVMELGFRKYDLKTEGGNVNIVRGYYQYDGSGYPENRSTVSYPAEFWQYTEEGYLIFEGSSFSDLNYVLAVSGTPEHAMLRVMPLDEKCRELNRRYILPVGYRQNNLFLCNWDEKNFGALDFYDLFDVFYSRVYTQPFPYIADENLGIGAVYQIPENIFEEVIGTYLNADGETLRSKTAYISECAAYEYRPRGFYEAEYPEIPYPEVVSYTENEDGTLTLRINAVYPHGNASKAFSHITVIRPLNGDDFRYMSNEIILPEEGYGLHWHSGRLTQEEWEKLYAMPQR